MNILIAGCGKTGAKLASQLCEKGHDVSIIAQSHAHADTNIDNAFSGTVMYGIAIDQSVLKKSGIDTCDVFIAMTDDDNTNIMSAQLAREIFKVPKILARVSDPEKANFYEDLGIETVCSAELTIEAVCASVRSDYSERLINFGSHSVKFTTMDIPKEFIGCSPHDITYENDETLFAIIAPEGTLTLVGDYDGVPLFKGQKLIFSKIV